MKPRILVVEDDPSFAKVVQLALKGEGFDVAHEGDAESAMERLKTGHFDIVITDLKLPKADGVQLLEWINASISSPPAVFVMTAYATVATAVEAMKRGAADYLTKPFSNDELILSVRKALRLRSLEDENKTLREALVSSARFENIVGGSPPMQALFDLMRKAAARDVNVLIRGETGTGKELVARAIHFASSRRDKPFVPVDSAAIPESLLESELFGHVKGAFTGAMRDSLGKIRSADGGSLFLDEIGDMQPGLQAKLLRVLQERVVTPLGSTRAEEVDIRVIAATHVDLEAAIHDGRFREDLYFRLNVLSMRIPPLRERKGDIPALARHFVSTSTPGGKHVGISESAMQALMEYNWPGNVRELQNAIEHALVVSDGSEIRPESLPDWVQVGTETSRQGGGFVLPEDGVELDSVERELILQAGKVRHREGIVTFFFTE